MRASPRYGDNERVLAQVNAKLGGTNCILDGMTTAHPWTGKPFMVCGAARPLPSSQMWRIFLPHLQRLQHHTGGPLHVRGQHGWIYWIPISKHACASRLTTWMNYINLDQQGASGGLDRPRDILKGTSHQEGR